MPKGNAITDEIASKIKAMKLRGDKNQDIAAWFVINQGRVSEVCGENPKPQYRHIQPEESDIPPPGPYEFGGGGIAQVYRVVIEMKKLWDQGDVRGARVKFNTLYESLGRPSVMSDLDELLADAFYDERGVPKEL